MNSNKDHEDSSSQSDKSKAMSNKIKDNDEKISYESKFSFVETIKSKIKASNESNSMHSN